MAKISVRVKYASAALSLMTLAALFSVAAAAAPAGSTGLRPGDSIRRIVDATIRPLMAQDRIPGMALGIAVAGKSYVFNYGFASIHPRIAVTNDTLFELGSVTKTFTATAASWAEVQHRLSLADTTAKYLPELQGTAFGNVTLLSLGTHTPGGLPLQFPAGITDRAQLMGYFKQWHPAYAMGKYRTYANPGIGMLGLITAESMGEDFRSLMERQLFPALGLEHSFIDVPARERARYAWGYTQDDTPIRASRGMLADETYAGNSIPIRCRCHRCWRETPTE